MSDPLLLERLRHRLERTAGAIPAGAGYWERLAEVAAEEAAKTISVTQGAMPANAFLAAWELPNGTLALLASDRSLLALQTAVFDQLQRDPDHDVWLLEIRRVLTATSP